MTGKGTLRRTLALLLVLVFALSNIGLAEMAEEVVQYTEPSVVEEPVTEEPVEEPTDDEPVADEPEVVEPEVVEPEAEAPEVEEPEAEAPEQAAPEAAEPEPDLFATPEGGEIDSEAAAAPALFAMEGQDAAVFAVEGTGTVEHPALIEDAEGQDVPECDGDGADQKKHDFTKVIKVGDMETLGIEDVLAGQHAYLCSKCSKYYILKEEECNYKAAEDAGTIEPTHTAAEDKCTKCEKPYAGEAAALVYDSDATQHWQKCPVCERITAKVDHIMGTNGKCTVCNKALAEIQVDDKVALTVGDTYTPAPKMTTPAGYTYYDASYTLEGTAVEKADGFIGTGRVTAVAAGTATLTYTVTFTKEGADNVVLTAEINITVEPTLTGVTLNAAEKTLVLGAKTVESTSKASFVLTATLDPAIAKENVQVTWEPADDSNTYIKVEPNAQDPLTATVTAQKATEEATPAEVKVTVKAGKQDGNIVTKEATCKVTVCDTLDAAKLGAMIKLEPEMFSAKQKGKVTITAPDCYNIKTPELAFNAAAQGKEVKDYVTYNSTTGELTPVASADFGATGTQFKITFTCDDFQPEVTAEKTFTITSAPTKISIKQSEADVTGKTLTAYETGKLTLTTAAEKAEVVQTEFNDVTWTSSEETVATVAGGVVSALKAGTTTITATAGGESASVTVNVLAVPTIALALDKTQLAAGETATLTTTITGYTLTEENKTALTYTFGDNFEEVLPEGVEQATNETVAQKLKPTVKAKGNANTSATIKASLTVPTIDTPIEKDLTVIVGAAATKAGDMTITLTPNKTTLAKGESVEVKFAYVGGFEASTFTPAFEGAISGVKSADDPFVYTVTANTAGETGTIKMIAWNDNAETPAYALTKEITVAAEAKEFTIPAALRVSSLTMGVGETIDLLSSEFSMKTETVAEQPGTAVDGTWKISTNKPDSVSVTSTETGWTIKALKKVSGAKLTVEAVTGGKFNKDITLTVKAAPTGISLKPASFENALIVGDEVSLEAKLAGNNVGGVVQWSFNPNDGTVEYNADTKKLKALKKGSVKVYAKVYNSAYDPDNMTPDKEYFTAEIDVTVCDPISETNNISTINATRQVIGFGRTTDLWVDFANNTSAKVTWATSNDKVAKVASNGNTRAVVTGKGAGLATITATVTDADGKSYSKTIDICVLTKITEISVDAARPAKMALHETFSFNVKIVAGNTVPADVTFPTSGDVKINTQPSAQDMFYPGLISVSHPNNFRVTEDPDTAGKFTVEAIKAGKGTLTISAAGDAKKAKKKLSNISVGKVELEYFGLKDDLDNYYDYGSDEDLYIRAGQSKTLKPNYYPTNATPNLTYKVESVSGGGDPANISYKSNKLSVKGPTTKNPDAGAKEGEKYKVTFSVGYDTETTQDIVFNVTVAGPATDAAASGMTLELSKVKGEFSDSDGNLIEVHSGDSKTISLAVGEQLKLGCAFGPSIDDTVTWKAETKNVVSIKKNVLTASKANKETVVTATTGGGATMSFTVTTTSKPAKLSGTTKVTLGIGETYKYELTPQSDYTISSGASWFDSNKYDMNGTDVELTRTATAYTFELKANDDAVPGLVDKFVIDSCNGKKTIQITYADPIPKGELTIIRANTTDGGRDDQGEDLYLTKNTTLHLKADMAGGYGALTWTVNGTAIDSAHNKASNAVTIVEGGKNKNVKAYWINNAEIAIVAEKKVESFADLTVKAVAARYEDDTHYSDDATVKFSDNGYEASDLDRMVFLKPVIGVGETTQATVVLTQSGEASNHSGSFTWSVSPSNLASIDANGMITAKKTGRVTVTAKAANNNKVKKSAKLDIVSAVSSVTGVLPETMVVGEKVDVKLHINGYTLAKKQTLQSGNAIDTSDILGIELSDGTIDASLIDDEHDPYTKILHLEAKSATGDEPDSVSVYSLHNAKAGAAAADITVLAAESKPAAGNLKIADPEGGFTIAPEFTKQLVAVKTDDTEACVTMAWSIVPKTAGANGVTVDENGLLTAAKSATGTFTVTATVADASLYESEGTVPSASCDVTVVKQPVKEAMHIIVPKTTLVKGERVYPQIQFDEGYDGTVTWSCSPSSSIKAVAGEPGAFEIKGKKGTAKIIATATYTNAKNKKVKVKVEQKLTLQAAPTDLTITAPSTQVVAGQSYNLGVIVPAKKGALASNEAEETLFHFDVNDYYTDVSGTTEVVIDHTTGKVTIPSDATNGNKIVIDAVLFEHAEDDGYVLDRGDTVGSITLTVVDTPKSVTLTKTDGTELANSETSQSNTVKVEELKSMTPIVKVMGVSGSEIPNCAVEWSVDTEGQEYVSVDPITGKLTALKFTPSGKKAVVTATASATVAATYNVEVTPVLRAAHLAVTGMKDSIGKGEILNVKLALDEGVQALFADYEIKLTKNNNNVSLDGDSTKGWTIKGLNVDKSTTLTLAAMDKTTNAVATGKDGKPVSVTMTVAVKKAAGDIVLTPAEDLTCGVGETFTVTASLKNYGGTVDDNTFEIAVKDDGAEAEAESKVIKVTKEKGVITVEAIGAGKATVTVTSPLSDDTKEFAVTVIEAPAATDITLKQVVDEKDVAIPDAGISMDVGQTVTIKADFGEKTWTPGVEWTATPTSAVTIAPDKMSVAITAKTATTVTVTAKLANKTDGASKTATLNIKAAPTAETVDQIVKSYGIDKTELTEGQTAQAKLEFNTGMDCDYTWEIDDETVATIDATGKVTAVTAGTVQITAKAWNGVALTSASLTGITLTVTEKPDGVELVQDVSTMKKNEVKTVTARAYKFDADGKPGETVAGSVALTSNNLSVVNVAPDGYNAWKITAGKDAGTAILTVQANSDDSLVKTYLVSVTETAADEVEALEVTVTALASASVSLTGDAKTAAEYNQSVISVAQTEDKSSDVTITAPLAGLKEFALTDDGAEAKYVGVSIAAKPDASVTFTEETIKDIANASLVGGKIVLWLNAEDIAKTPVLVPLTVDAKSVELKFSLANEVKDPMVIDILKLKTAPADVNQKDSQANQDAISVTMSGDEVTVTGDYSALKEFESTDEQKKTEGKKKWIGFEVVTGTKDITKVEMNGAAYTEEDDVADANSVGLPAGSAVVRVETERLYEAPISVTFSMVDNSKLPRTITFNFVDNGMLSKFEVTPATSGTHYGKTPAQLQTGVAITGDKVSGTLHYNANYKDFSGKADEQAGYYLALDAKLETGMTVDFEMTGGEEGVSHAKKQTLSAPGDTLILLVKDAKEKIEFTVHQGEAQATRTLDLSGLKFDPVRFLDPEDDAGYEKKAKDLYDNLSTSYSPETGTYTITANFKEIKDWTKLPEVAGEEKRGHYFAFAFDPAIKDQKFSWSIWNKGDTADTWTPKLTKDKAGADELYWVLKIDVTKKFKFEIGADAAKKTIILDFTENKDGTNLPVDWTGSFEVKLPELYGGQTYSRKIDTYQSDLAIKQLDEEGLQFEITGDLHYGRVPTDDEKAGWFNTGEDQGYYLVVDYKLATDQGFTAERQLSRIDDPRTFAEFDKNKTEDQQVSRFTGASNAPKMMTVKVHKYGQTREITYDLSKLTLNPVYIPQEADDQSTYFGKKADDIQTGMTYKMENGVYKVSGTSKKVDLGETEGLPDNAKKLGEQHYAVISFDPACIKNKTMHMTKGEDIDHLTVDENKSNNCGDDECDWLLNIEKNKVFKFVIDEGKTTEKTYILDFTGVECAA